MNENPKINQRIKQLRGPLSQKEFALKLGISLAALQNYEAGKRIPPTNVVIKLADMFNMPSEWLLTGQMPSGLILSPQELKELKTLESKESKSDADRARMKELWMVDARAQVRRMAWIEGIELPVEDLEKKAREYLDFTVSGIRKEAREGVRPLGVSEEAATFQISLKGQIAAHNRPILEKMMQQLADIMAEGDYRKTGALQSLLDLLAPKKEEGKVK